MKEKTFLHLHRNDVSMTMGGASIEHPLSIHSASIGTSWTARGLRYIASILMILTLCVRNAWAIEWTNYASSSPTDGEKYILFSNNTKSGSSSYTMAHFLKAPDSKPTGTSVDRTVFLTDNAASATWFTFHKESGDNNNYKISYSYTEDATEKTGYITTQWGESGGSKYTDDWRSGTSSISILEFGTRGNYNNTLNDGGSGTNAKYIYAMKSSTKYVLAKNGSNAELRPWILITTEAYEDATAGTTGFTGAQYYYTVGTQVYTNGEESSTGGSIGVVKPTYKKPAYNDWTAVEYQATSIAKSQKGKYEGTPTITIFAKVIANTNDGYEFNDETGFTTIINGDVVALTNADTKAPNTYYEVDAENHIYSFSFAANGTNANPTAYVLCANFTQSVVPTVNVYDTNNTPTGYATFAEALANIQDGYKMELLSDVENITETITLPSKSFTLDFNNHKIKGADVGAPTNLIAITGGSVAFDDYSTSGVGGVKNTGSTAVKVSGGSLTINNGVYEAVTYAVERTDGTVVINNGGFKSTATPDISGTMTIRGGFYQHNGGLSSLETGYVVITDLPTGMKYDSEEYSYMVLTKTSPNYPLCVIISEQDNEPTIRLNFNTLESAIAYVNNNIDDGRTKTILLKEDYALNGGTYTIPVYTTLVITYSAEQRGAMPSIQRNQNNGTPTTAYCTLTLKNGTHLDVFGAVEVGGEQTTGNLDAAGENGISRPGGETYGLLLMNSGSSITMNNGSNFYAWGFVQGEGTIDVRRGAVIKEQFQLMDWKGFAPTAFMAQGSSINYQLHALPVNQYFIQNIEVKATYRPGSKLFGQVGAYVMSQRIAFDDIGIIGVKYSAAEKAANSSLKDDVAIFLMDNEDDSEDTWVRKSYDIENDQQLYEVSNSAYLGSLAMIIDLEKNGINIIWEGKPIKRLDVDSRDFTLPLSNNFKIHLLNGKLAMTQGTELLPGTVIEIEKKATMVINSGQTLYMYDTDQWGTYVFKNKEEYHDANNQYHAVYHMGYGARVRWRPGGVPTVRDISSPDGLGNAQLIVHGSVDVKGYLKSTTGDIRVTPLVEDVGVDSNGDGITDKDSNGKDITVKMVTDVIKSKITPAKIGGSSIVSTIADAGTIIFNKAVPDTSSMNINDYLWQVNEISSQNPVYVGDHVIPALLRNDAGSKIGAFSPTARTQSGQSFCFIDLDGDGKGEWMSLTNSGCFVYDQNNVYYIKPQAYVPISIGAPAAEADHTYRDHYAGTNKIFIQTEGCQWWEVTATANPEVFYSALNNMYYYWDDSDPSSAKHHWAEKKFKVEWKDFDGEPIVYQNISGDYVNYYYVSYGTVPQWLSATPAREADDYYTYEFDGWSPTPGAVTKDTVYTATYKKTDRNYLITFKDKGGKVIENQYLVYGASPACLSYTLASDEQWSPALANVTKDQEYTIDTKKTNNFTITFVNWNGAVLKQVTNVELNTSAADVEALYDLGVDPEKEGLDDEVYEFDAWTPEIVKATADAVYTATFTKSTPTYTIRFLGEGGTPVLSSASLAYGAMPTPPAATKTSPEDHVVYTLVWIPLVGTVTGDQDYIATFTEAPEQFTVTWKNWDNSVLAVDYVDYNSPAAYSGLTPKRPTADNLAYTFTGWNTTPATKVTANVEYTAQYSSRTAAMTVNTDQSATPEAADATLQTLTITPSGVLNMGSHKLTVDNLILQATETTSGQLLATNVTATNAYFDLTISATTDLATGATRQWHAFGVPWQVNLDTDPIQEINGEGNVVRTFVLGRDYDIIYYNGDKRATNGSGYWCWEFLENHAHQLQPGQGYMIAFVPSVGNVGTIRLAKKNFAPVMFSGSMSVENSHGEGLNNGWNAIANPKACNARLNAGPTTGYVYDPANDNYKAYDIDGKDYIVGRTVYVQVNASGSVVINNASGTPISPKSSPAYRERATDKEYLAMDDYYQVAIASTTTEGGHVYVLPEEDKENKYVIGHDLAQFGMSAAIPQVWVNRYDTKLALNTTALFNETAEFPMGVYAPAAGEYTISLNAQPSDEYNVYLTRDGQAIWNLSDGAFTADLKAGIQSNYGLRLTVNKAPQVVTGVDEAVVDAKGETRKVMINNQVYIIRGEQVYTIDGQLVK